MVVGYGIYRRLELTIRQMNGLQFKPIRKFFSYYMINDALPSKRDYVSFLNKVVSLLYWRCVCRKYLLIKDKIVVREERRNILFVYT